MLIDTSWASSAACSCANSSRLVKIFLSFFPMVVVVSNLTDVVSSFSYLACVSRLFDFACGKESKKERKF